MSTITETATASVDAPSRSHRARMGLMVLYVQLFFVANLVLDIATGTVGLFRLNVFAFSNDPEHRAELHHALHGPGLVTLIGAAALHLLVFAALGQRAGYRGVRILQLLIPLWNYAVMRRILWRWTDITAYERAAAHVCSPAPHAPAPRFTTQRFTTQRFTTQSYATPESPRGYVVPQYGAPAIEEPIYRVPAGYVPVDVTPASGTMDITPGGPDGARKRRFR